MSYGWRLVIQLYAKINKYCRMTAKTIRSIRPKRKEIIMIYSYEKEKKKSLAL